MRVHPSSIVVLLAATMGFIFAAVSTYDSAVHLDRQVHGIHCSYFLGAGETDATGTSGCYATLMSSYSSVFRKSVWGGIPVALPGMAVFGFLCFAALWIIMKKRARDVRAAGFLLAASLVPLLTTFYMAYIAMVELDTVCKICVGIYIASILSFLGALWLFIFALRSQDDFDPYDELPPPLPMSALVSAFALGVLFVAVPIAAYAVMSPDFSKYVGNCGKLSSPEDPGRVLIPLGPQNRDTEMIEVMDPLCAACGVFEKRFQTMPEKNEVRRRAMLFPLDKECNWMVNESVHPGACAVSEAVLCAENRAEEVLDYAIAHRETIVEQAKKDPTAAARMMSAKFPELSRCIGSAAVRAKLNLSLRWAVKNQLHVLTPQIYIDGYRLCDEDTDLGLEYALSRLIAKDFTPGAQSETASTHSEAPLAPAPPLQRERKTAPKKPVPSINTTSDSASPEEKPTEPQPAADDLDAKLKQVGDHIDALAPKPATDTGIGASPKEAAPAPAAPAAPAAPEGAQKEVTP